MSSNGESEVGARAGERVGRMMNGTSLALGSIAGAFGDDRSVVAETCVHNELMEVGGFFFKVTEGFGNEVLG